MVMLINKAACKKAVLEIAERERTAKKFTRVSADVFEHLNSKILEEIRTLVRSHPSVGCTIMMGSKKRTKQEREGNRDFWTDSQI
jgi:hypothetical protein